MRRFCILLLFLIASISLTSQPPFAAASPTPPNPPILETPPENWRVDVGGNVTFTWTFSDPDAGDNQSAYRFQLDDDSDFSSPIIDTGKVNSSYTSTTQTMPMQVGLYYWRVKTWDAAGEEGNWSSGRAIIADCFNLKAIDLTAVPDAVLNGSQRLNVGEAVTVWFTLSRAYDDAEFNSSHGTVYVNGTEATWDAAKRAWKAVVAPDAVGAGLAVSGVVDEVYDVSTVNSMLSFDGDDYVKVPDSGQLSTVLAFGTGDFTVSCWVYIPSLDQTRRKIIQGQYAEHDVAFDFRVEGTIGGTPVIDHFVWASRSSDGLYRSVASQDTIEVGKWHHLVGIRKDGTLYFYLDNVLQGSREDAGIDLATPQYLWLGTNRGASDYLNGIIAEVRIYNRALSTNEIKQLYRGVNITDGLVLYFDGTMRNGQLIDKSGNGNHGTIYGAVPDLESRPTPKTLIWDRVLVTRFWASKNLAKINETVTLYAETQLEYDGHPADGDDALSISGVPFTWDWSQECWVAQVSASENCTVTYDTLTEVYEATYGVTVGHLLEPVSVTWSDYGFIFHGLYSEAGGHIGAVNVTAYLPDRTLRFTVNGTLIRGFHVKPSAFSYPLPGGGYRYIYTYFDDEELWLLAPDGVYATYGFEVRDYTGRASEGLYLESLRMVNDTLTMVERMKLSDLFNQAPLTLTDGVIYHLRARLPDGAIYDFGDYIPGVEEVPILQLTELTFTQMSQSPGRYIRLEAVRPRYDLVRVNYLDELGQTVEVEVSVTLLNGTEVWYDSASGALLQFNWWDAINETDYVVWVTVNHTRLGLLQYSWALAGAPPTVEGPPDVGVLGTWPVESTSILAAGLILLVAGAFSMLSAPIGVMAAASTAAVLDYLGWIDVPYVLLALAFFIAVALGLLGGGRR